MGDERGGNRLGDAASPYLRDAADQPVDWRTWGEEAFEEAKEQGKPVLLDSGAVWCHWCHVMDHESYEDEETAEIINEHFVPVKLDRDERPEVDSRYQEAVQAMTGQGGWPLTAFLTPDGTPFYGGTYFPPEPRFGRPSFRQVLQAVAEEWADDRDQVVSRAERLVGAIQARIDPAPGDLDRVYVRQGLEWLRRRHDPRHGGFGDAPKFPHPPAVELLLAHAWAGGAGDGKDDGAWAEEVAASTLAGMADGGIHDHLGGGFHRYSTDRRWLVPHFEKMAYDNAGLLANYAHLAATGQERWADVARGIADHVLEVSDGDVGDDGPGLYGSQDADVGPGDDGSYWTWTPDEVREASPDHADLLIARFGVTDGGNMPHGGRTVLHLADSVEALAKDRGEPVEAIQQALAEGRQELLAARRKRESPYVDTTPYAAWNGMLVRGLLEAAWVLDDDALADRALAALDLVLDRMTTPDEGVHHVLSGGEAHVPGLLEDNVHVGRALLCAFQHGGGDRYLEAARDLADLLLARFQHDDGAFMDHAPDIADAPMGPRFPVHDNPTPSGNGTAVLFLEALSRLTGEDRFRDAGATALEATLGSADAGAHSATLLGALWCYLHDPPTVTLLGDADDDRTRALHRRALATHAPWKVVLPPGADHVPEAAADEAGASGGLVVCFGTTCTRPTRDVGEVADRLAAPGA